MNIKTGKILAILSLSVTFLPGVVNADSSDSWDYGLSIYGWFPDLSGQVSVPAGEGGDFSVPIDSILDNLKFTFQGSFDARKDRWGLVSDVIYMDLGDTQSNASEGTVGGQDWPFDVTGKVKFDMKSWIWTTSGYYRVIDQPEGTMDLMAGFRYADVKQSLDWSLSGNIADLPLPGRDGGGKVSGDYWDVIIGARGNLRFGADNSWFIPYYADIGTGDSDLTWQVSGGIGYSFNWGDMAAVWRYLSYDMPSNKPIKDMEFSGPVIGAVFRW